MQGAAISASEKPARIDTASMPSASAARAAATARCIAPSAVALRSVELSSGGRRQASTGRARPLSVWNSSRAACSPVSYMSTCG